jgi:hypothetical protein
MSNEKTIQISDAITGATIIRNLTASEIKELDKANSFDNDLRQAQQELRKSAFAKLAALGLTPEEVKVAFGLEQETN